ncbi:MAG: FkbM family methyltransferase [Holophagales bacterium]|nr:FkbM family methyltransferase [Holophagales bacterium]
MTSQLDMQGRGVMMDENMTQDEARPNRLAARSKGGLLAFGIAVIGLTAAGIEAFARPDEGAEGPKLDAQRILHTGTKLYSQNDEELIIRDFFGDRREGFFLDVGAGDWRKNSTTLYLEKHLGWTGIGVDARGHLRRGYDMNRPGTRFEAYAVTDATGGTIPFYFRGDISSVDPTWKDQFPDTRNLEAREVQVPQITLDDLLARLRVDRIDFLSMDIEGSEEKALAGFDIDRFAPELVCLEMARGEPGKALLKYFEEHGYELLTEYVPYDKVNRYFARRTDE